MRFKFGINIIWKASTMMIFVLATKESIEVDLCKLNIYAKRRLKVLTASSVNEDFAIVQIEKSNEDIIQCTAHTICVGHAGMQNSEQLTC